MKKFDPKIIFIAIGSIFLARFLGIPILVVGVIAYFIYKMNNGNDNKRDRSRRYEQRDRNRRYETRERRESDYQKREYRRPTPSSRSTSPKRKAAKKPQRNNPFKASGVTKFKDYDYDGAIVDFTKALEIDARDIAVHFNIACAYSLTENKDKAFYHVSKAVELGFKDFEKIKTHDALAFLRIQDEFDQFEKNGYRWQPSATTVVEKNVNDNSNLLDQLKQLAELREKGLLTEEEFLMQKKKLLR